MPSPFPFTYEIDNVTEGRGKPFNRYLLKDAEGRLVAYNTGSAPRREGDFQLLAASPVLLAACRKLLETWKRAGPSGSGQLEKFDTCVHLARVAVDVAEGEIDELPADVLEMLQSEPGHRRSEQ